MPAGARVKMHPSIRFKRRPLAGKKFRVLGENLFSHPSGLTDCYWVEKKVSTFGPEKILKIFLSIQIDASHRVQKTLKTLLRKLNE